MRVFNRIEGESWPMIELLIQIPSTNLADGTHKLGDIVITSSNGDVQHIPGPEFEVKTIAVVSPSLNKSRKGE